MQSVVSLVIPQHLLYICMFHRSCVMSELTLDTAFNIFETFMSGLLPENKIAWQYYDTIEKLHSESRSCRVITLTRDISVHLCDNPAGKVYYIKLFAYVKGSKEAVEGGQIVDTSRSASVMFCDEGFVPLRMLDCDVSNLSSILNAYIRLTSSKAQHFPDSLPGSDNLTETLIQIVQHCDRILKTTER
jgi:hypothetical protein